MELTNATLDTLIQNNYPGNLKTHADALALLERISPTFSNGDNYLRLVYAANPEPAGGSPEDGVLDTSVVAYQNGKHYLAVDLPGIEEGWGLLILYPED